MVRHRLTKIKNITRYLDNLMFECRNGVISESMMKSQAYVCMIQIKAIEMLELEDNYYKLVKEVEERNKKELEGN